MSKTPFFMRFVEKQDQTRVPADVKAGAEDGADAKADDWRKALRDKGLETMKYPSDGDEEYTW